MKILVALPTQHPNFYSIDEVLEGKIACSGTNGSCIRLAALLAKSGLEVCLSTAYETTSNVFSCLKHDLVNTANFDYLIVHHSHWDGTSLTFGNTALCKTFLWLQNPVCFSSVYTFVREGGRKVICLSMYHANLYRAIPNWSKKVAIVPNTYAAIFTPDTSSKSRFSKPRLVFSGALRASKGFVELTKIWSYLAQKEANIELAIAGGISIHSERDVGSMGLAEKELENSCIKPWLQSLPPDYQPIFLGALTPMQLRDEFINSWAAIVNPGSTAETFCVAAVDAQACDRTVFSVEYGALTQTVYREKFNSLAKERTIESVGDRILDGLNNIEAVAENGRLAGEFVRSQYNPEDICNAWIDLMSGKEVKHSPSDSWNSRRDLACDLMRWSSTGILMHQLTGVAKAENRKVMNEYRNSKKR